MTIEPNTTSAGHHAAMIRIGGTAIIIGLTIHIVLNMVIKVMPPDEPTLEELKAYLLEQKNTWTIVHGMRYVAFACIAIFAAAMFMRTWRPAPNGWAVVGLLGATMMLASAFMTNGIETFLFLDFELLGEDANLFYAIFYLTRVVWTAEVASWGVMMLGFSLAGWQTARLPRWLALLGMIPGVSGLLSGVFIVSIFEGGAAGFVIEIATLSGLLWFLCAGVYLLVHRTR